MMMDNMDYELLLHEAKQKAGNNIYADLRPLGGVQMVRQLKKELIELRQLRAKSSDEARREELLYLILCGECQLASIQDLAHEELLRILEEDYGIEMLNWYLERDNDQNF